ncbi:MAG: phage portal protein [Thermomicrobiales bacterium]
MLPLADDPWATRDAARRARYRELLDFYEGRQWLGKPLPGERRLTANYARALVRKVASYLFPEPVTFTAVPDGTDEAAQDRALRAEVALAAVYAANDLAAVDFNAAIDAAVLGDGAFKVTWDATENASVTPVDVQHLSLVGLDDLRRVTRVVQRRAVISQCVSTSVRQKEPCRRTDAQTHQRSTPQPSSKTGVPTTTPSTSAVPSSVMAQIRSAGCHTSSSPTRRARKSSGASDSGRSTRHRARPPPQSCRASSNPG